MTFLAETGRCGQGAGRSPRNLHSSHDLQLRAGRAPDIPPADGPLAQLDRALPSEGRGQRFESSTVRHHINIFAHATERKMASWFKTLFCR